MKMTLNFGIWLKILNKSTYFWRLVVLTMMEYFIFSSTIIANSLIRPTFAIWKRMVIMCSKTISLPRRVHFGKFKFLTRVSISSSFIKKEEEASKNKIMYYHVVHYFLLKKPKTMNLYRELWLIFKKIFPWRQN
jgi:hypothetical protein